MNHEEKKCLKELFNNLNVYEKSSSFYDEIHMHTKKCDIYSIDKHLTKLADYIYGEGKIEIIYHGNFPFFHHLANDVDGSICLEDVIAAKNSFSERDFAFIFLVKDLVEKKKIRNKERYLIPDPNYIIKNTFIKNPVL